MKKKIYGFNNGGSPQFLHAVAIGEDGAFLTSHICTSELFMLHDLGIKGSDWKHDIYDKHFGEGNWEIEWVATDQLKTHEGLNKAIKLNKTIGKSAVAEEAKVEITFTETDVV